MIEVLNGKVDTVTPIQYAIARHYAQQRPGASSLEPEIRRYREVEDGPQQGHVAQESGKQGQRQGQLFEESDNLDVAAAVRRIGGGSRRASDGTRALHVEKRLVAQALRVDPFERRRQDEEIRISLLDGERERQRVQRAEREAAERRGV